MSVDRCLALTVCVAVALLLGTQTLFSPTLQAQPWMQAHYAAAVATWIIASAVLLGTLMGLSLHRFTHELHGQPAPALARRHPAEFHR